MLQHPLRVVGLALALTAAAVAPEIRDEAKLFSPEAVKKADERIREIYEKHHRDVLIETFATVPAGDVEKVKAMDAKQRDDYFLNWAKGRFQQRAVTGVYILICKEPRYLRVAVDERKREPLKFPEGTRAAIENAMRKEFKEGRFDQGLEQAVQIAEEKIGKAK